MMQHSAQLTTKAEQGLPRNFNQADSEGSKMDLYFFQPEGMNTPHRQIWDCFISFCASPHILSSHPDLLLVLFPLLFPPTSFK